LAGLLERPRKLVLSGINHGPKPGTDVSFSHRFGGDEGTLEGLRALAGEASACFQVAHFAPGRHPDWIVASAWWLAVAAGALLLNLKRAGPPGERESAVALVPAGGASLQSTIRTNASDLAARTYYVGCPERWCSMESGTAGPAGLAHRCGPDHAVVPPSPPCSPKLFLAGKGRGWALPSFRVHALSAVPVTQRGDRRPEKRQPSNKLAAQQVWRTSSGRAGTPAAAARG